MSMMAELTQAILDVFLIGQLLLAANDRLMHEIDYN
jgi:hypothetical protein